MRTCRPLWICGRREAAPPTTPQGQQQKKTVYTCIGSTHSKFKRGTIPNASRPEGFSGLLPKSSASQIKICAALARAISIPHPCLRWNCPIRAFALATFVPTSWHAV
jgi:hypothetical protein